MPYVTVVETSSFVREASAVWTSAEYETFVTFIALNPEAGDIVPESGGVRKVRWAPPGMGKRGGVRVIYYYATLEWPLFL